jgi:anti-sigma factor ChrR (cupin superfamily)
MRLRAESLHFSHERVERLKQGVLRLIRRATGAGNFREVPRHAGWVALAPRVEAKALHHDGHGRSWLLRLQPGGALPAHDHDAGDEECLVVEGSVLLNGVLHTRGDYQLARQGSRHHEVYSEHGCVLFLRSVAPRARQG